MKSIFNGVGRLFFDPYAEILMGDEGKALVDRAVSEVGQQPAIAVHIRSTRSA